MSPVLDERLEPRRATEAAAQYLTELHARFGGDWALAIAAYNGGRKAIENVIAGIDRRRRPRQACWRARPSSAATWRRS